MTQEVHLYRNQMGLRHDTGEGHPECATRIATLDDLFDTAPFDQWSKTTMIDEADEKWIRAVHPQSHIDNIMECIPDFGMHLIDSDTVLSPHSFEAAMQGAAAVCHAVQNVCESQTKRAFCAIRPPGHHAEPHRAMGFCLFGNAAIAAAYARQQNGIGKIAIVDFDVHHGNGTQAWLKNTDMDDILFISSHQFPFYPGTGDPDDNVEGRIHNIAMAAGTDGKAAQEIYEQDVYPRLETFKPELIIISAGFDAHKDDPLGGLNWDEDDFYDITNRLCCLAGKTVSTLEGGYNLHALQKSVRAHLLALAGLPKDQSA